MEGSGEMAQQAKRRRVTKAPEQRREEILQAALGLFHERGFDTTTVQEIAEVAGVAAGTVYLYFPSKDALLRGIHEDFHQGMHEALRTVSGTMAEGLAAGSVTYERLVDTWIDTIAEYARRRGAECTVICRYIPNLHEPFGEHGRFVEFVAAALAAATEAGYIHVSDPQMAARMLVPALRDPFMASLVYGEPDLDRFVVQAKELFRKALAPGAD